MMIGAMRERVRFVRRGRTQRADGGYDVADSTLGECWAAVRPVQAREGEQGGRLAGLTTYLVTIHADAKPAGLTIDDHVVWLTGGNVAWNLRAIRQGGSHELMLELVCEAGAVL